MEQVDSNQEAGSDPADAADLRAAGASNGRQPAIAPAVRILQRCAAVCPRRAFADQNA
jgi:hypothetical protein